MSTDDKKSKKKDKRKSGGEDDLATKGLPSTEFLIKPETSAPKIDTSKYVLTGVALGATLPHTADRVSSLVRESLYTQCYMFSSGYSRSRALFPTAGGLCC
jgi:hypothetical protein